MNVYLGQRFRHLRIPCNFSQSIIFLPDCLCVQRTAHTYSLIRTFSGHTGGRKESKGPLGGERRRLYLARAGVQDGLESSLGKHSLYSRKCCVLTHMLLFFFTEKPGTCPAVRDDGFGICLHNCDDDSDCPGGEKCCKNECGGKVCK